MLTASVIIRTKNDHRSLAGTLERVFAQAPAPLEVIVADAGSTDRTLAVADASDALVLTVSPEDWSCGRALNRAARVARGDVLVMLSPHCRPRRRRLARPAALVFRRPDRRRRVGSGPAAA